jgi:hypothetical protein
MRSLYGHVLDGDHHIYIRKLLEDDSQNIQEKTDLLVSMANSIFRNRYNDGIKSVISLIPKDLKVEIINKKCED